jgi:quinol monooxygenase YgiN
MVRASVAFSVRLPKRSEALSAFDSLGDVMRRAPGCSAIRLLSDQEDGSAFEIVSEWSDADDAEAFFASDDFRLFRGIRILLASDPLIVLDHVRSRTRHR